MKFLFYPIEKVREYAWTADLFVSLTRSRQRNSRRNRVVEGRFLLTGPARSGNTFASYTIRELLEVTDFVHHNHTIAILKKATEIGIPIYILFREPDKVVLSNALYASSRSSQFSWPFNKINRQSQLMLDYYLYRWIRYYRFALSMDGVTFFDATDLFAQPYIVAEKISADCDLELRSDRPDLSKSYQAKKRAQSIRQSNQVGAGIPTKEKEIAKEKLKHLVEKSRYYPETLALYQRLHDARYVRPTDV